MKKRDRDREDGDEDAAPAQKPAGPFNNPFAAALAKHPAREDPKPPVPTSETKRVPGPARAVVRMERKGHGGKEVTVVEQLGLQERDLERWLKALKQSLGCGGRLEGGNIVLQGDHRNTLKKLLEDRGVKKVTVSGS